MSSGKQTARWWKKYSGWYSSLSAFEQNPGAESGYHNVLCADGNFSPSKPVSAAWLADCPEYRDPHHRERHVWFWCECPKNELGDYIPPDEQHPQRDHNLHRKLSDPNTKAASGELSSCHILRGCNVFRQIPCIVSDLPMPDLLHTMQIGMLDHLQKWIFHFMKRHEQLDKYNVIWVSVPAYNVLTPNTTSYEEVSHWNGKEMKEMSRYLLRVVTWLRRGGSPAQRSIFNHAIECTQALLEFYMYVRYKSPDDATLSYMEDALHCFHNLRDVFFHVRASENVKAKANALRMELMKRRKVGDKRNAERWTPSRKRCETNPWRDYISREIDVAKELDADFNFLKIHLMCHCVKHIRRYGALQQYFAERHDQEDTTHHKDVWNASNHTLNVLPQVITFQHRILCIDIGELNLQALAQHLENSTAASNVLLSGDDLAAPLSPQSYVKLEFMSPQNRRDGKHPDTMINDFRALLNITHNATQRVAISSGMRELFKHKSRSKTYISDDRLHAIELCIYPGIKVQVEGFDGECIAQMCRCTGSQRWRRGDRKNDWVWVMQRPGRCYRSLSVRLPWQLQWLIKIKLLSEDGAFVEYWLALALSAIPQNSGNLDPIWKVFQVTKHCQPLLCKCSVWETLSAARV